MKLVRPYSGKGNGNVMAKCMSCDKLTHTTIAQEYAIFSGTDMVFCRDCVDEAVEDELYERGES